MGGGGRMFWVYILISVKTGKTYTGQTGNLTKRINSHNCGEQLATKHGVPWKLIHKEEYYSRSDAMKRERFLKSGKGREFIKREILPKIGAWPSLV
jgi:putative endonuclease